MCVEACYGRDARKADDMRGENRVRGETREARNVGKEECNEKIMAVSLSSSFPRVCLVLKACLTLVTLSYDMI